MRACKRVALGVAVALIALPALADWKDDYARGLEAVRDGRWGEAARLMDSAMAGNAQPAPRLRLYGQRYEVYAPQHYAGLAAFRQGDCAGALRQWNQSANQAFVAANGGLAEVEQRGRAECGSAVASQNPPATTPPRSDAPATKPAVVETRPETPTVAPSRPPADAPAAPPAQRPVVQAPPASTPPPSAATKPPVAAPITPTETRTATSAAAEALRPVLEAYLGGRYADVLKLSAKPAADARVGWHLMTLRAAAAWQLSQVGGDAPDTTVTARQAVTEARRLDAKRRPDATFYSPKFIAFYDTL